MNDKQRFRNFIGRMPIRRIMAEHRAFMPAHSTKFGVRAKQPASINNFLNMIEPNKRHTVLTWLKTEGIRQASVARQFFTREVNQMLKEKGVNISLKQNDIFSPIFWEQHPELSGLKDQIEKDWFDRELEPRFIPIGKQDPNNPKGIDIYKINAHLAHNGQEPMTFGGLTGLLSKEESGEDWDHDEDQFHTNSDNDQQGHDLSLAPGDVGLYQSAGKEASIIQQQIADAAAAGDYVEVERLKTELEKVKLDAENSKTVTKLGLDNGYVPSTDTKHYGGSIKASVRDSMLLLNKFYKELKADPNKQFTRPELKQIQALHNNQQLISVPNARIPLQAVLGAVNRQEPSEEENDISPENIVYAKGIIKAVFMDLLSRDPSNPGLRDPSEPEGGEYGVWPTANPALGIDSKGFLPKAKVVVTATNKYDHKDHSLVIDNPTPENIEAYADKLADWMVDDQHGLTTNKINISRGSVQVGGKPTPYGIKMQISDFFSPEKYTKAIAALRKMGQNPFEVNYTNEFGEKERRQIHPKVALEKLDNVENQTAYKMKGKIAKPEKFGANQDVTKDVEAAVEKQMSSDGRYVLYKNHKGKTQRARRSNVIVDPNTGERHLSANPVWYAVGELKDHENEEPLISPLKINTNIGVKGLVPTMKYDKAQTSAEWDKFLQDPMAFGEPKGLDRNGVPDFVNHALGANKENIFKGADDPRSIAMNYVAQQIANPCFMFGDFKGKSGSRNTKERKRDARDLLSAVLPPEEIEPTIQHVKNALFGNPGKRSGPRTLVPFQGPAPFAEPNLVRQDVYEQLLKNGYDWRTRKAASATRSNIDKSAIAVGQGGGDADDVKHDVEDKDGVRPEDFIDSETGETDWDAYAAAAQEEEDRELAGDELDVHNNADNEFSDENIGKNLKGDGPTVGGAKDDALGDLTTIDGPAVVPKQKDWQGTLHKKNVSTMYPTKGGTDPQFAKRTTTMTPIIKPLDPIEDLGSVSDLEDLGSMSNIMQPQPQQPVRPPMPMTGKAPLEDRLKKYEHTKFKSYQQWLVETDAVYDPKVKIKDGCGFNWWGAAGNPLGVSIAGGAATSKSDPTGKASRNGKSRSKKQ